MSIRLLVSGVLLFGLTMAGTAHASLKYECWTYKNGKPYKMTHVVADNKDQALKLAAEKFKKLDIGSYDSLQCK